MGTSARAKPIKLSLDAVGATTSMMCALHCAAVALMFGTLPVVSLLAASWVEWVFLSISIGVGLFALVPGYRRHRLRTPLVLFVTGITILLSMRLLRMSPSLAEMGVVGAAAALLVTAHWKNRGAMHRCQCGPRHH
jgi:MerC mercury resistance protein